MVSSTPSYADDDCTASTFYYVDGADATSAPTLVCRADNAYLIYSSVCAKDMPALDDDYFYRLKEWARKEAVYLNSLYIEYFNKLQIAKIFNTYSVLFYRRMMFPKSGFLARAGRKRRN